MKEYRYICELSPDEIKTVFSAAYDMSKPLGVLAYDALGIHKGTFCRIRDNRVWLFRTVPLHFFPKRHFSGVLLYDGNQSKTKVIGRFVYSPWYLLFLLAVFLLFFLGPAPPEHVSSLEYLTASVLMTCLFGIFAVLLSRINMKPRETEIIAEMEALLEAAHANKCSSC